MNGTTNTEIPSNFVSVRHETNEDFSVRHEIDTQKGFGTEVKDTPRGKDSLMDTQMKKAVSLLKEVTDALNDFVTHATCLSLEAKQILHLHDTHTLGHHLGAVQIALLAGEAAASTIAADN